MSVRRRLEAVEDRLNVHDVVVVPIVWIGRNENLWRARAEEARRRGWSLNIIRIGVVRVANTVEEAEAIVTQHKVDRNRMPVTVYRRGAPGGAVLAKWAPELPEWLQEAGDA